MSNRKVYAKGLREHYDH